MANRSRVITMSPLVLDQDDDLELDLDLWEVVNPSDGEYSDDSYSVDSLSDDDVISMEESSPLSPTAISLPPPLIHPESDGGVFAADLDLDGHIEVDDSTDLGWAQRRMVFLSGRSRYSLGITYGDYVNRDGFNDEIDEDHGGDDGEYNDSYDLYDELVPRKVSAKLERQRMMKLGKRAIAKVITSKTSPYSHLKPGCVRGKHGLGMKFR